MTKQVSFEALRLLNLSTEKWFAVGGGLHSACGWHQLVWRMFSSQQRNHHHGSLTGHSHVRVGGFNRDDIMRCQTELCSSVASLCFTLLALLAVESWLFKWQRRCQPIKLRSCKYSSASASQLKRIYANIQRGLDCKKRWWTKLHISYLYINVICLAFFFLLQNQTKESLNFSTFYCKHRKRISGTTIQFGKAWCHTIQSEWKVSPLKPPTRMIECPDLTESGISSAFLPFINTQAQAFRHWYRMANKVGLYTQTHQTD